LFNHRLVKHNYVGFLGVYPELVLGVLGVYPELVLGDLGVYPELVLGVSLP